jgi:4-hydroxy-tetrahydrodipicolinate reductase
MTLTNIGVSGCLGRMGQELVKEIINNHQLNFTGGFEQPQHKNIHKKISDLIGVNTDHIVSDDPKKIFSNSDVVIDFTTPQSTLQNVLIASELSTPIVIGTTGLDEKAIDAINQYSNNIPILQSSNMSVGINLLFDFVNHAASTLKDVDYDIEISESHHRHKVDAPSGTAITLGEQAAKGRKVNFDDVKELNRIKLTSTRKKGSIGFAVTRGGEIAGEHTVSFIGKNDRIDLVHKAQNRSIFVKGAIKAAVFLSKQKKGLYSIKDIVED